MFLGEIAKKQFRLLRLMLPFRGLSVCLSCLCIVQMAEDFFCVHQPHVCHITLTFDLHQSTPSTQILPQSDPPPLLCVGD